MTKSIFSGKRMKELRAEQGLTQKALGEKVGLSQQAINLLEHDKRRMDLKLYDKIADILDPDHSKLVRLSFLSSDEQLKEYEEIENWVEAYTKGDAEVNSWERELILLEHFRKLNKLGEKKAIEQVELLTKIPEYRKE